MHIDTYVLYISRADRPGANGCSCLVARPPPLARAPAAPVPSALPWIDPNRRSHSDHSVGKLLMLTVICVVN